jgi:hypothetical protein
MSTVKHAMEGTVFTRIDHNDGSIEYVQLDSCPEFRQAISRYSLTGRIQGRMIEALVRRGPEGRWCYYPLPLLLGSEAQRKIAAEARGKRPPNEDWVERVRTALSNQLQVEL